MRDDAHYASWWTLEDDKTMTAWCTDEALRWVGGHQEERGGQPFFLHVGTWDPHSPWDRPEHAGLRREVERPLLYRTTANEAVADTRIDWW